MERKVNIPMALACVLLCLTLITTHLTGGLFARYTTTTQASDSARVAKWDVDIQGLENPIIEYAVSPNNQGAYNIQIANNSEVAMEYSIRVIVAELGFDIDVTLEGKTLKTDGDTELDFGTFGPLAANSEKTHNLTFAVENWNDFTKLGSDASIEKTVNFTVYIDAVQVD